jgi:hypothetical protein
MSELPVLHITASSATWLARGQETRIASARLGESMPSMAKTVLGMLKANKLKKEACILSISADFYRRRQLDLPAALTGRELREVLERKASNLLETSRLVRYQAIPLYGARQTKRSDTKSWLLFALEARTLQAMIQDLLRVGVPVKRVVAAELAYQGLKEPHALGDLHATVQVAQLEDAIGVTLLCDHGLVSQNLIPTHSLDPTKIASALVQELRSVDSYWRKISGGGAVTRAYFSGFPECFADALTPATLMVMQDIQLTFEEVTEDSNATSGAHIATMRACRSAGPLAIDFTYSIPPRRITSTAFMVASLAALCSIGFSGRDAFATKMNTAVRDLSKYLPPAELNRKSEELKEEIASLEGIRSEYEHEWAAIQGTSQAGIPFDGLCSDLLSAFAGQTVLESLAISRSGSGFTYEAVGVAPAKTKLAAKALSITRERLSALDRFGTFSLVPEAHVPTQGEDWQQLRFTILGVWNPSPSTRGER